MKKIITKSFEETQKLGFDLAKNLKGGEVICLHGNLGSGKTTFVQGLAKGMGVKQRIISPTFIIVRSYEIKNQKSKMFYHVDLYRVENDKDVESLGLLEIINDKENIVVIEWADKIEHLLPSNRVDIIFNYIDDNRREIIFE